MASAYLLLAFLSSSLCSGEAIRVLTVQGTHAGSHHIWFSSLPQALAARGHEIHSIDIRMPKFHPANLHVRLLTLKERTNNLMATLVATYQNGSFIDKANFFTVMATGTCRDIIEDEAFQEIINPKFKKEFDVIIINSLFHECLFGLIHRFNYTPLILTTPFPAPVAVFRHMANPAFHAIPHFIIPYNVPLSLFQRIMTLAAYFFDDCLYYIIQEPAMNQLLKEYFGKDTPSIRELEKHIAMAFVNLLDINPKPPLSANIISVGGMHIPEVKPLEGDLKEFLDGAKEGAVIMSFGTLVRGDKIGREKLEAVLKVFSRLPQRFVWKYDNNDSLKLSNIPSNVLLQSWLPQNDVLAHPNIRLFISHCGGLSSQEAAYHGIPILGIPFIVDQYANAEQVVASGAGLKLPITDLTEETFYSKVIEVLTNPKYYATAQRMKAVMQDQLVTPLERAVFYVEYVARHRGAPHLRSPLVDLPLSKQTLLVDVAIAVTALIITLAVTIGIVVCMLRKICTCVRRTQAPKTSSRKKEN